MKSIQPISAEKERQQEELYRRILSGQPQSSKAEPVAVFAAIGSIAKKKGLIHFSK